MNKAVSDKDIFYMDMALKLARRGGKAVRPNPLVGAVIVKNKRIVSKGYHCKYGAEHAETAALNQAGAKAKGATLYVTLQPCNHFGQTPPCTQAVIAAGIKKVVLAVKDPNPLSKKNGIKKLKAAGIEVVTDVLKEKALALNEPFFKYIVHKRPFTVLKMAMSVDGKTASRTGDSRWITSVAARKYVHDLRAEVDAVMVGVNTVIKDDPGLYPYLLTRKNISVSRIIVDSKLRVPLQQRIFKNIKFYPVIMAVTRQASKVKIKKLEDKGVEFIICKTAGNQVDLDDLFKKLGSKGISFILAEGGATLAASLFKDRLVDKALFFIAPKIIGGKDAPSAVGGKGIADINQALKLKQVKTRKIGPDILIEGYLDY